MPGMSRRRGVDGKARKMKEHRDEIFIHLQPWNRNIAVLVKRTILLGAGGLQHLTASGFKDVPPGREPDEPTIAIDSAAAQQLANALWFAGFRPEVSSSVNGELAAKDNHIHDLRALVFKGEVNPKP